MHHSSSIDPLLASFEKMKNLSGSKSEEKNEENMAYDFSEENLDKIREDAEYVKEQLKVN